MKKNSCILAFAGICLTSSAIAQTKSLITFTPDTATNIRAIAVVNDSTVWFGGSNGSWGYTTTNGSDWKMGKTELGWQNTDFRSIAVTPDNAVLIANIASPGYILRTNDMGSSWRQVYKNENKEQFFDALVFSDDKNGWALGDPQKGCIQLLKTVDGGLNWSAVDCAFLPKIETGEAFFASSNTSIDAKERSVWIATGGPKARVIYSSNRGKSWKVSETPLQQGEKMTGIFSLAMYNEKLGVVAGGNYDNKAKTDNTIAISVDGGKIWKNKFDKHGQEIKDLPFVSCIQFVPKSKGKKLIAACLPGIYYSDNYGRTWVKINDEGFYTFRFSPSGKTAWFAGAKGKIGRMDF
ncbi:WD40/YVTN/BNR-like repeat-containing protein [Solitalea canadensis]|uniref:Putative photosystem II stability/assembly factor-like protein n=1 Tax=Solitalea canadensis (strain ATCC 29591 / DSM 3403 / JCM 21819 / LMG 8368 / NBRC 15130 / NCIMB 12057 / USAM 9D) TaxID=929556 RepID=H8KM28_SOLCM|nr:photosystem II stability/assembly factor-like protein [Solitalea canadensis]AFD08950.1 putative photosystem II stability/assembly factor-like protein [Solitalea canadensis DSM 3403]